MAIREEDRQFTTLKTSTLGGRQVGRKSNATANANVSPRKQARGPGASQQPAIKPSGGNLNHFARVSGLTRSNVQLNQALAKDFKAKRNRAKEKDLGDILGSLTDAPPGMFSGLRREAVKLQTELNPNAGVALAAQFGKGMALSRAKDQKAESIGRLSGARHPSIVQTGGGGIPNKNPGGPLKFETSPKPGTKSIGAFLNNDTLVEQTETKLGKDFDHQLALSKINTEFNAKQKLAETRATSLENVATTRADAKVEAANIKALTDVDLPGGTIQANENKAADKFGKKKKKR